MHGTLLLHDLHGTTPQMPGSSSPSIGAIWHRCRCRWRRLHQRYCKSQLLSNWPPECLAGKSVLQLWLFPADLHCPAKLRIGLTRHPRSATRLQPCMAAQIYSTSAQPGSTFMHSHCRQCNLKLGTTSAIVQRRSADCRLQKCVTDLEPQAKGLLAAEAPAEVVAAVQFLAVRQPEFSLVPTRAVSTTSTEHSRPCSTNELQRARIGSRLFSLML